MCDPNVSTVRWEAKTKNSQMLNELASLRHKEANNRTYMFIKKKKKVEDLDLTAKVVY